MPQIIDPGPGFGGQLGAALGSGLSSGLQYLAQHKLAQVIERQAQRKEKENFESAGFTPQESQFLASQPAQLRPNYIRQLRPGGLGATPGHSSSQQLQDQAVTPQEQQQVGLQELMASLNPRSPANPAQRQLEQVSGASGHGFLKGLMGRQQSRAIDPDLKGSGDAGSQRYGSGSIQPQLSRRRDVIEREGMPENTLVNPEQQRSINVAEALTAGPKQKRSIEQEKINAEARKSENEFATAGDIGKEIKEKLGSVRKLVKSGKLSNPIFAATLGLPKKIGVDLTSLLTPETGELIGSENVFYPLIPYVIKGNVTDKKLEAFRDKLPKATDSDAVKLRKIDNIEKIVDDMISRGKASRKVAHKYGDTLPANFRDLVYESAGQKSGEETVAEESAEGKVSFDGLPDPSTVSGKKFRDKKTGEIVQAVDGKYVRVS